MAVLLTRPHPDNEDSAARLRARGLKVLLAPMLRLEPIGLSEAPRGHYDAVIVTSANALRAIEPQLARTDLTSRPLFAVGERTAAAARRMGFGDVIAAGGDSALLRDCVLESAQAEALPATSRLLYLTGADLSRDLVGELAAHGIEVVAETTYRMIALATLPAAARAAFAANDVEAVLHYSGRSAAAFLEAVRKEGLEISALAVPQCVMSAHVAAILHEAGAAKVNVAASADENALFEALDRALRSRLS